MVYPVGSPAPLPNADLPDDVKADYLEASSIVQLSPRAAAALLRLAVHKLIMSLGGAGKSLSDDIGSLVHTGLLPTIQQALDVVRVVGNNAVHPGELDLRDDMETATQLFHLVNIIAEYMISVPKQVQTAFGNLPVGEQAKVAKRDARGPQSNS
jgi:hypothetical protein